MTKIFAGKLLAITLLMMAVTSVQAYIIPGAPPPPQSRPRPRPPVYPPQYGADLSGYCPDYDHSQFAIAKAFAYDSYGLNMTDADATRWALDYNNTHTCNTINEYKARFEPLRAAGYASDGLNLTSQDAVRFALSMVETVGSDEAREMAQTISTVRGFAYSSSGLNMMSMDAARLARQWVEARCENSVVVNAIAAQFSREYSFAYSSSGLNMTSQQAIRYAASRVAPMSRCGSLLQR